MWKALWQWHLQSDSQTYREKMTLRNSQLPAGLQSHWPLSVSEIWATQQHMQDTESPSWCSQSYQHQTPHCRNNTCNHNITLSRTYIISHTCNTSSGDKTFAAASLPLWTTWNRLQTVQIATGNISVWETANDGIVTDGLYARMRNTLTYLLASSHSATAHFHKCYQPQI